MRALGIAMPGQTFRRPRPRRAPPRRGSRRSRPHCGGSFRTIRPVSRHRCCRCRACPGTAGCISPACRRHRKARNPPRCSIASASRRWASVALSRAAANSPPPRLFDFSLSRPRTAYMPPSSPSSLIWIQRPSHRDAETASAAACEQVSCSILPEAQLRRARFHAHHGLDHRSNSSPSRKRQPRVEPAVARSCHAPCDHQRRTGKSPRDGPSASAAESGPAAALSCASDSSFELSPESARPSPDRYRNRRMRHRRLPRKTATQPVLRPSTPRCFLSWRRSSLCIGAL